MGQGRYNQKWKDCWNPPEFNLVRCVSVPAAVWCCIRYDQWHHLVVWPWHSITNCSVWFGQWTASWCIRRQESLHSFYQLGIQRCPYQPYWPYTHMACYKYVRGCCIELACNHNLVCKWVGCMCDDPQPQRPFSSLSGLHRHVWYRYILSWDKAMV